MWPVKFLHQFPANPLLKCHLYPAYNTLLKFLFSVDHESSFSVVQGYLPPSTPPSKRPSKPPPPSPSSSKTDNSRDRVDFVVTYYYHDKLGDQVAMFLELKRTEDLEDTRMREKAHKQMLSRFKLLGRAYSRVLSSRSSLIIITQLSFIT